MRRGSLSSLHHDLPNGNLRHGFQAMRRSDARRAPDFLALVPQPTRAPGAASLVRRFAQGTLDLTDLSTVPIAEVQEALDGPAGRGLRPALAERLIEASHGAVRNQPETARRLAALAGEVAIGDRSESRTGWQRETAARAAAHQANALRVGGDLRRARATFERLRRQWDLPKLGAAVRAEVARLEVSLLSDERRFGEARRRLEEAEELYWQLADLTGYATCLVKRANLAVDQRRPQEVLEYLEQAATLLDPSRDPVLYRATVTGRIHALCDLGRAQQAQELLTHHWPEFLTEGDTHLQFIGLCLRGRVFVGLERFAEAEQAFLSALRKAFEMKRHLDAAMVNLYLAETYLAQGKMRQLRETAVRALSVFTAQKIGRESHSALQLLADAARRQAVTPPLLRRVRRQLRETA